MAEELETNEDKINYINEIIERVSWKKMSEIAENMAINDDLNNRILGKGDYECIEPSEDEKEKIKSGVHPNSGKGKLIRYDGTLYGGILVVGLEECVTHKNQRDGIMNITLKPNFLGVEPFKKVKYEACNMPHFIGERGISDVEDLFFFKGVQCKYNASIPEGVIKVSHTFNVANEVKKKSKNTEEYINKEFFMFGKIIGAVRTELIKDRYLPL